MSVNVCTSLQECDPSPVSPFPLFTFFLICFSLSFLLLSPNMFKFFFILATIGYVISTEVTHLSAIHICTTRSPQFNEIYDIFSASLQHINDLNYTLSTLNIFDSSDSKSGFKTNWWYKVLLFRWQFYSYQMSIHEEGSMIAFVDSDVVFFPNPGCMKNMMHELTSDVDMICMSEDYGTQCNGGMILMRITFKSREFVKELITRIKKHGFSGHGDQDVINQMLVDEKLSYLRFRFKTIPTKFYWWGSPSACGKADSWTTKDLCFMHAVCTYKAREKLLAMREGVVEWYQRVPKLIGKAPSDFPPSRPLLLMLGLRLEELNVVVPRRKTKRFFPESMY